MKTALTSADLEAQSAVLELPERELLGALITVYSPIKIIDLNVLNVLLRNSFNHWDVNVLRGCMGTRYAVANRRTRMWVMAAKSHASLDSAFSS
jgi:hypothetical protein